MGGKRRCWYSWGKETSVGKNQDRQQKALLGVRRLKQSGGPRAIQGTASGDGGRLRPGRLQLETNSGTKEGDEEWLIKAVRLRWHLRDNAETEGMSSCGQRTKKSLAG